MANLQELMAASAMMTTLERIASSGILSLDDEIDTRRLIIRAGRAFGLDALCERPAQVGNDPEFEATVELLTLEMGRTA